MNKKMSLEFDFLTPEQFKTLKEMKDTGLDFWVGGSISLMVHVIIDREIHDIDVLTMDKERFKELQKCCIFSVFYPDNENIYQARIDKTEVTMILKECPEIGREFTFVGPYGEKLEIKIAAPVYSMQAKVSYILQRANNKPKKKPKAAETFPSIDEVLDVLDKDPEMIKYRKDWINKHMRDLLKYLETVETALIADEFLSIVQNEE